MDLNAITSEMDARRATLRLRHETVVLALQALAEATQPNLLSQLDAMKSKGLIQDYRPYWISNLVRLVARREVIAEIAARQDVGTVYYDYEIESIAPVGELVGEPSASPGGMRTPVWPVPQPRLTRRPSASSRM